ncbi:MAG: TonB family protein [Sphingomonas sp.]
MYPLLLAFAAVSSATGLDYGPVPTGDPADWVTEDDYPRAALRAGVEGVVVVALGIDAFGQVERCAVSSGSGSRLLDGAACGLVSARGRFRPASDAMGDAVPGVYEHRVAWRLPSASDDEPAAFAPYAITVAFDVDTRGHVESCRPVSIAGGARGVDSCAALRLLRFAPPLDAQGRPMRLAVRFRTSMEAE